MPSRVAGRLKAAQRILIVIQKLFYLKYISIFLYIVMTSLTIKPCFDPAAKLCLRLQAVQMLKYKSLVLICVSLFDV